MIFTRPSALVRRLEQHLALTEGERDALDWAERRERRVAPGEVLVRQDGPMDSLYVVQHGWLHSSIRLKEGARQILRFHYAGDLVGVSSIAWNRSSDTLTAISDCIVSELSKPHLGRIFKAQPRLGALLYALAAAEFVAMSDRLTSVGRMNAVDRISTLLLDILARFRVTAGGVVDWFDLPLTQTDIGDAVGLTKVHVNRVMRAMEADGLIERSGRRIRFLDEDARAAAVGFVDRYWRLETDWLPGTVRDESTQMLP